MPGTLRPSRSFRLAFALVLAVAMPRLADAHAVGISRGDYEVRGGSVTATLLLARFEIANVIPELDLDGDGTLSASELRAGQRVLDEAIVQHVDVTSGGSRCPGTLQSTALAEEDGLSIRAVFRCSGDALTPVVTLAFLDRMAYGHRHVAAIGGGAAAPHFVAYSGHAEFPLISAGANGGGTGLGWPLVRLGVSQVLTGYGHLVFLLGLVLVGGRVRSLVLAVTAFTVAHSLALGASALGLVSPSSMLVEPAIALSIAYVGIENWFVANADGRWLITLPLGVVHGFGLAGALEQIPLPRPQVPLALASFNVGVEAGQLAVLLLAIPTLLWLRKQQWFADRGVKVASAAVAVAGVWWFVSGVA